MLPKTFSIVFLNCSSNLAFDPILAWKLLFSQTKWSRFANWFTDHGYLKSGSVVVLDDFAHLAQCGESCKNGDWVSIDHFANKLSRYTRVFLHLSDQLLRDSDNYFVCGCIVEGGEDFEN